MVVVHPPLNHVLKDAEAEELVSAGKFADDTAGLNQVLSRVTELWAEAEERARRLDPALLDERVDGEWSFLETVRHLIFAADSWVSMGLLGGPQDFHRLGMPPAHAPDEMREGLDVDARPSLEEVLAVRAERQAITSAAFRAVTEETLLDPTAGWGGGIPVAAALQVIVREEVEHLRFAHRDLDRLTGEVTEVW